MFPMFHRAVQKEVIHRLPTAVTRTTLPYQCIPPPHKVHTSEYPQAAVQTLKETPWDFDRPNTLPSEFQLTRATLGTLWQQKPTQKQPLVCVCVSKPSNMHLQYQATTIPNAILLKLAKSTFTDSKTTNQIEDNYQTFLLKT
jgi:hypothetical protein